MIEAIIIQFVIKPSLQQNHELQIGFFISNSSQNPLRLAQVKDKSELQNLTLDLIKNDSNSLIEIAVTLFPFAR